MDLVPISINTLGNSRDLHAAISGNFAEGWFIEINKTFITLVPKNDNPQSMSDYRPISCCNVIDKIIANILYDRFKGYTNVLVSYNQNALFQAET